MNIEQIQSFCKSLQHTTEDIKWEHDLCFCIASKMYCVVGLNEQPVSISFKVTDQEFDELCERDNFSPAPYVARYKWVRVVDVSLLPKSELEGYIKQSYELIKSKLPSKIKKNLNI